MNLKKALRSFQQHLHSVQQQAEQLGREDQLRLYRNKKLVLMVDLDQTLIHTTEQHCQRMSNKVLLRLIAFLYCPHLKPDFMHKE